MRVDVDTAYYRSAMDTFYDLNHTLTDAVADMSSTLQSCPAMAGTDTGGRDWATSYDSVAGDMVTAGADLGGSMGSIANLLNASLVNHEGADYGARVYGPPIGSVDTGDSDPEHGTEHYYPGGLPSAAGGAGGEPDGWNWLVEHLGGWVWPDADTDKMRSAGSAWESGSQTLASIAWSVDYARTDLETQRSPEIASATRVCTELRGHCDDLSKAYHDVGQACTDYANHVDEHHDEIIGVCQELLAWTVADQVTGAILSFFTAGAAEVAAQLVEAGIMAKYAERVISILRRLAELARAAARIIGSKLGKVGELLAKLKKFISAGEVKALEETGEKVLEKELAAVRKLLADSEKGAGHTIQRHVGLTDAELAARGIKRASTFTDEAAAERGIAAVMKQNEAELEAWLKGGDNQLVLNGDAGATIGRTLGKGEGASVPTSHVRIVIRRDPTMPGGYYIHTSYPTP